jgi:hypothetical protein
MTTLQTQLRDIASQGMSVWGDIQIEAADRIDELEAQVASLKEELMQVPLPPPPEQQP